jgi:hypothetical protein
MAALRADERFVDALAEALAERVARRLARERSDAEEGYLDAGAAASHICAPRRRIHELTSAGLLRPDGRDGRRPLYLRSTLEEYVRRGAGGR